MSIETEKFNQLEELFKKEESLQKKQEIAREQINILKTVQEQFIILAQDKGYSLDSYDILEKLLEQSKEDGFKVVFVYAPIYARLKQHLNEDESVKVYEHMSNQYDVPILDFSNMDICSNTDFFKDANHLNSKGSEIFSLNLAQEIDSLGILSDSLSFEISSQSDNAYVLHRTDVKN